MRVVILFFLLAGSSLGYSQEFLLLDGGHKKRIKIAPGSEVVFKVIGTEAVYRETLTAVFDTAAAFGNLVVPFRNFEKIRIYDPPRGITFLQELFLKAGIGASTIFTFNRIIHQERPHVNKTAFIFLAVGSGGVLLYLFQPKWFRPSEKNRVRYLDLRMEADN